MTISIPGGTAAPSRRHSVHHTLVGEVMTPPAATIGPTGTYVEAVTAMLTADVGGLPVVDDEGALLGVVTAPDLVTDEAVRPGAGRLGGLADLLLGRDAQWLLRSGSRLISEVMSRDVVTVTPDTTLARAAELMWTSDHRHLPVVRDGVLVGVLADRDLLRADDWQSS